MLYISREKLAFHFPTALTSVDKELYAQTKFWLKLILKSLSSHFPTEDMGWSIFTHWLFWNYFNNSGVSHTMYAHYFKISILDFLNIFREKIKFLYYYSILVSWIYPLNADCSYPHVFTNLSILPFPLNSSHAALSICFFFSFFLSFFLVTHKD